MRRFFALSLFISSLAIAGAASAQQMPAFNIPQIITQEDVASLGVDFDDAFNTIDNEFLSSTMKLNYQISLLEKLVTRQAQLEKISDSYAALGIPYNEPPPPRGICAQLPANAPCLASYPDLYSDLVGQRKAYYDELDAKKKANMPGRKTGESDAQAIARAKKDAEEKAAKAAAVERKNRYRWSDLTCLSGQCHGVLVKSANADSRYTVRTGTHLPDGTIVQDVSAQGIQISINGDVIHLRPSPGDEDASASGNTGGAAVSAALSQAGVSQATAAAALSESQSAAAGAIANAQSATGAASAGNNNGVDKSGTGGGSTGVTATTGGGGAGASGQSVGEPPIGPSGLF